MRNISVRRFVNLLFLACIGSLLALPTVGLGRHVLREFAFPSIKVNGDAAEIANRPRLSEAIDHYIASNFGLREAMVNADARLQAALGGEHRRVARGTDGFLFYKDDDVFAQVTGQRIDHARLQSFLKLAESLQRESTRADRQFLVVIVPNKHTVYRRYLPPWARGEPKLTERSVLMEWLGDYGIDAIDLAPHLIARADSQAVYWQTDTHWTRYGMLVGFNEMLLALGRPGDRIAVEAAYDGKEPSRRRGDLVAIAGLGENWEEVGPRLVGPDPFDLAGLVRENLSSNETFVTYRVHHDPQHPRNIAGPRIMVIGDSFMASDFDKLFMRFGSAYLWVHHRHGGIDKKLIDDFDPDILILQTVERFLPSFSAPESAGGP